MNFRGKEKIVWSLNNYLGLANHPDPFDGVSASGEVCDLGAVVSDQAGDLVIEVVWDGADFSGAGEGCSQECCGGLEGWRVGVHVS
jgi:7-keto-8-aminopelargonate synthetase-like enzyme